ncbi:MAG: FecR family protein [Daejeonella sp.]
MEKKQLNRILEKFAAGNVHPSEQISFNKWLLSADETEYKDVLDRYQAILQEHPDYENANPALLGKMDGQLTDYECRQDAKVIVMGRYYLRITAAAAVLVLFTAIYFFSDSNSSLKPKYSAPNVSRHEITPGGNKAILTLGDGSRIILDDSANGEVANQAGVTITKTTDGQLVYTIANVKPATQNVQLTYNTIETPKGGQYQINLPDGSKVWLNAASSLRFPTAFTGKERQVELTGEAYFEVIGNRDMPFRVACNNQVIEVLGTHFNINSYTDEKVIKTTLLEGSVKVISTNNLSPEEIAGVTLQPGQQSQIATGDTNNTIKVVNADTNEAVAWKNGYFMFNYEGIQSVMRKISRWYDAEIEYKGNIPNDRFGGSVSRFKNVSEVLDLLELTGQVHFKIKGRRITVMP